jgi:hypothetical protein
MRVGLGQMKSDVLQQIEIVRNDINMDRSSRDCKMQEKVDRIDVNGEKALDEIYTFKD